MILYIFSRKGFFITSSYIFIGIFFIAATFATRKWGVDLPAGLLFYVLIIIMSGILVNTRFAFLMAIISSLFVITIAYLQINSIISPDLYWKAKPFRVIDSFVVSIIFFIIATVSWLSNREIEKSLKRARISEAKLKKERDLLEVKVEERTRELKKMQMDKITQLYRFAEFGRLSAGLFHDLMNHLTAVSLNMERIKNGSGNKDDTAETKSYLSKAIVAARQMESFVIAVRGQISKQENKNLFSLTEEIEQIIQVLLYKARKANVKISFFPPKNIQIFGDSIKFNQMFSNLIANAIDAYAADKEISADNKAKEVVIRLGEKNGIISLSVEDYGRGIAKENIGKIFEPFFTTKKLEGGMGIGLSLTKKIIEKDFHGSIEIESEKNRGSKFTVIFPKNQENT